MDYRVLAAELRKQEYDGMSDEAAAAALNAETIQVRKRVTVADLMARAYQIGLYPRLVAASDSEQTPADLRAAIKSILDLKYARFDAVDLDDPASAQMFGALQAAGLASAQELALLNALADGATSRAAQLGLGYVSPGDVQQARGGGY